MADQSIARRRIVDVPYSEAAMHAGLAGQRLEAVEECRYVNGQVIRPDLRFGCYLLTTQGTAVLMLKSEAGWHNDGWSLCPVCGTRPVEYIAAAGTDAGVKVGEQRCGACSSASAASWQSLD